MGLKGIRSSGWRRRWVGPLAALALVAVSAGTFLVQAKSPLETQTLPVVAFTGLPVQGQKVMDLIRQGGPFRYEKDGTVFGNRERLLPAQKRGYYREYTVPTPGLRHRGARRIVCGGQKPVAPDNCYYTEDHYASFRLIVQ
ncbi:MAG: ribonuclease [Hydrogenophaga sp.]|jgi:ribonuclease T1|nr:ribonuclease [Hydrogenophaga sp.]